MSTGAHDITVPTSGVFLNMVTKSGTDVVARPRHVRLARRRDADQNIDDELLRLRLPARRPTPSTSSPTSTSAAAARSIATQAAHVSVVPRLARARQRAGGVLGARPRQDGHHVRPGQPDLPAQRQEPVDRLLLAPVPTRSRTASSPRRTPSSRNRPATKTTCSTSTRRCGTRW